MKQLVRKNILNISPYIAGKPIEETKRELGLKDIIKLASNENPIGVCPKAISAIIKNASSVNRYPDSCGFYLKKRLAKQFKIQPSNIVLGNGSDELIDTIIKTFVEDDENVVTSSVTFLEYEIISKVNNRKVITCPLKNFGYDLTGISKRVNRKTKVIFIANPNNPTGTYINRKAFESFAKDLPKGVLVVLDEAYDTFIDVKDFTYGLKYINNKNILVLKTFSKAYGLAGLRVGYCLGRPEFTAYMEKVRQPFNVNLLAQAAALASLDDKKFLKDTRKVVLEGKNYLYRELRNLKLSYVPSVANFILMDVRCDGFELFKNMLERGVIVRDMRQYGLKNFIRVTIGTRKENMKLIQVLKKALAQIGGN